MKLYLHIGTEKTGSSYLQTLLANNRNHLIRNGYYFPDAGKREKDMLKGNISPGNGRPLCKAVLQSNQDEIKRLLTSYVTEAKRHECHQVLISNEELITAFSEENHWVGFSQIAKQMGFFEIKLLLFLRGPVEQALSLYKHRAKNGNVPGIELWVREAYNLHNHLEGFIKILKMYDLDCSVRKYKKDSHYMKQALFADWLGIDHPERSVKKKVNPSLTLSELKLIRLLYLSNPKLIKELYDRLAKIPQNEKAKEPEIEARYREILTGFLSSFETIWRECNLYLSEGEKLEIPEPVREENRHSDDEEILKLSPQQAKCLTMFITNMQSPGMQLKIQASGMRKSLGRFKSHIFSIFS